MLLIHCPYCGPRPELEFSYGGQAHVARPADPSATSTPTNGPNFCTCATTRAACTPSAGVTCAAARDFSMRCVTRRRTVSCATYSSRRADAEAPARGGGAVSATRHDERRSHRPRGRCGSRSTAGPITGFAGDTLASALLANGVQRVRPLLQISPPARHARRRLGGAECAGHGRARRGATHAEPARDAGRDVRRARRREPESLAERSRFDVRRSTIVLVAAVAGGVLLQDVHVAAIGLASLVRARRYAARRGSAARRRRRIPDRYAQRFAHCDVLVVGARSRGARGGAGGGGNAARASCSATSRPSSAARCWTSRQRSIDGRPRAAVARVMRSPHLARDPNVTLLPRTTAFGYFPHNMLGLCERLTDHLAAPAAGAPRERLWQVRAREVVLATGAIERPLVFPGNDRPGVMLASARTTYLHRYGVRVGERVVLVTGCDAAYATALDLHRAAGIAIAPIAACATALPSAAACGAGIEVVDRRDRARHARPAGRPQRRRWARVDATVARPAHGRLRCVADVRRLHAERAPVLAVARQAAPGTTRRRRSCRRDRRTGALGGRVPRRRWPRGSARRRRRRRARRGRARAGTRRARADRSAAVREFSARWASPARCRSRGMQRRRGPSSISRTT